VSARAATWSSVINDVVPGGIRSVLLRTLARYRAELIERRAPHINHMIQALKHMNVQLNLVLSDITGVSGLAMLRAIRLLPANVIHSA
jgi:hypothetical protein